MLKYVVLLIAALCLSSSFAGAQFLPQPLPDDPGQQLPTPPPSQPPSGTPIRYSLGVGDLSRFQETEFTFYPQIGLSKLVRLSLTGGGNNLEIKEVRIQYADTVEERLDYVLPGELKVGATRTISMNARPIYRIIVTAATAHFWKKPGSFRVDVAAYR